MHIFSDFCLQYLHLWRVYFSCHCALAWVTESNSEVIPPCHTNSKSSTYISVWIWRYQDIINNVLLEVNWDLLYNVWFSLFSVWGVNCGGLAHYESWRKMFIERPRLHFNGCYISKTTYVRNGENSFQDQFYRPWHIVEYYRYLRYAYPFCISRCSSILLPFIKYSVSVSILQKCSRKIKVPG
jgi:hypothetical protein